MANLKGNVLISISQAYNFYVYNNEIAGMFDLPIRLLHKDRKKRLSLKKRINSVKT
jgi:hypothetical protein